MALSKRPPHAAGRPAGRPAAFRIAVFTVAVFAFNAASAGHAIGRWFAANAQDEPIKLKTTLVQVPVVVSDRGGRYVTDLRRGDFELFEDGVSQPIEFFKSIDEPFTVALLLDSSGSTSDQLNQIKSAALAFIDNLRERDRVMVVNFDDSVHVQCGLTNDQGTLRRAVAAITSGEFTQVYEAVYTAVWEKLRHLDGRKAVIVFTDGIDTASSEIDEDDTLDAVVDSENILVYPIRYSTRGDVERRIERRGSSPGGPMRPIKSEQEQRLALDRVYREADEYLDQLAKLSGGKIERADTLSDLQGAFAKIADELRHQYLLGYYPPDGRNYSKERKITVRVSRPNVMVRARPSYRVTS